MSIILLAFLCIVGLVSIFTSQAKLSPVFWCHSVHADDADDNIGGVQFYSYGVGVCVGVAFTISHTAVTCWVCSPSPVLQSNTRVQQKLGVVALPYTSTFTLSNTAVTCWDCFPSPVLISSITVKQKLGVVALPYTLMFMLLLLLLIGLLVLVLVSMYDIIWSTISLKIQIIPLFSVFTCFLDAVRLIIRISCSKWCWLQRVILAFVFVPYQ